MNLALKTQRLLEARIRDIISPHCVLKDVELFFFGSRVDGTAGISSDIDVGIMRKDGMPVEHFAILYDAITTLDSVYKIDFVDFATVSKEFKAIALKHRELF